VESFENVDAELKLNSDSTRKGRHVAFHMVITPFGKLTIGATDSALIMLRFGWHRAFNEHRFKTRFQQKIIADCEIQIAEYVAGKRFSFDLPLDPQGTEFQKIVWGELSKISYGVTINYGEQARRIGRPKAARAVGAANGRNPIAIIIPCHRVIGVSGSLTGFAAGLEMKRTLLNIERQFKN